MTRRRRASGETRWLVQWFRIIKRLEPPAQCRRGHPDEYPPLAMMKAFFLMTVKKIKRPQGLRKTMCLSNDCRNFRPPLKRYFWIAIMTMEFVDGTETTQDGTNSSCKHLSNSAPVRHPSAGRQGAKKAHKQAVLNQIKYGDDSSAAACRSDSHVSARNDISHCEATAYASACDFLPMPAKYISGEDRTRTPLENAGETGVPQESGTESGTVGGQFAPSDPDLAAVVAAWPDLPETTRRKIVATIREAVGSHGVGDGGAR